MDMQILIIVGIIAVALLVIGIRQVGSHYGKIRPSQEVAQAYRNFRLNPNFKYYSSGSDVYPQAIIGIDKTWTLESDLWISRDLAAQNLRELVQNMQLQERESGVMLHGFDIYDNREAKIGDCFSASILHTPVKITGERRVIVFAPPP